MMKYLQSFSAHLTSVGKWFRSHFKILLCIAAGILALWLILIILIGLRYQHIHKNDAQVIGVSFSKEYALELGNDWKANYLALLDDAGFRHFRLMSYWDEIQPQPGVYNFSDLDWQMNEAAQRGGKVSLAIGERQPRWPECRRPAWVEQLPKTEQETALLSFIQGVVGHYKNHPALESYQLENEVANRLFSPHCEIFDREKLQKEFTAVKQVDDIHPLIINASNQTGVPVFSPVGDGVGFSIYKKSYVSYGPLHFYWSFSFTPALWHSYRAGLTELLHPKSFTFIHELQAEPWGPAATKDISQDEQRKSMTAEGILSNVRYAQQTGMHTMYLWGGEWWYWQKNTNNDPSTWDAVKSLQKEKPLPLAQ